VWIECGAGDVKYEIAREHRPEDPDFRGVFAVLVGRAPAPLWQVRRNSQGQITEVCRARQWPHVQHYYFQIIDPQWGHVVVRLCGYAPWGAQVIVNGHEWVERQARAQKVSVAKAANCFVEGSDFEAINRLAAQLSGADFGQRLEALCERWAQPSQRGHRRLAGLDLNKARNPTVIAAVSALATQPEGFTTEQVAQAVRGRAGWTPDQYPTRRAAYDLAKVRGKGLLEPVPGRRRYQCRPEQLRVLCAYVVLRDQVIKPVLAGVAHQHLPAPPPTLSPLDEHYCLLRAELRRTCQTLGLAA
jgi:hypothetical protein